MKRKKDEKFSKIQKNSSAVLRLNRYISNAGVCSRREADNLITDGKVKVNGKVVTTLGTQVQLTDRVEVEGKTLSLEKHVYILLNKPRGYITTTKDPQERKTVMELISKATNDRVYPVGRLDRNSSGLLLFTNDGEMAQALTHPSKEITKLYAVTLDKPLTKASYIEIMNGVELEDGMVKVDEMDFPDDRDRTTVGIRIHSGKNRVIRRLFAKLGYEVEKLDRVMLGILTKKDLPRGKWRYLTPKEVRILKSL